MNYWRSREAGDRAHDPRRRREMVEWPVPPDHQNHDHSQPVDPGRDVGDRVGRPVSIRSPGSISGPVAPDHRRRSAGLCRVARGIAGRRATDCTVFQSRRQPDSCGFDPGRKRRAGVRARGRTTWTVRRASRARAGQYVGRNHDSSRSSRRVRRCASAGVAASRRQRDPCLRSACGARRREDDGRLGSRPSGSTVVGR